MDITFHSQIFENVGNTVTQLNEPEKSKTNVGSDQK
jgi:hypothetical protein